MGHGMHELSGAAFASGIERERKDPETKRKEKENRPREGYVRSVQRAREDLVTDRDGIWERGDLLGRITNTCIPYHDLS